MEIIAEILQEIQAAKAAEPRSQQTEIGASQLGSCRAALVMHALGVPRSDERPMWRAFVGSAIDAALGSVRGRSAQTRLSYRGILCTVDEIDEVSGVVRDWKTKDSAAEIAQVRRYGPHQQQRWQIMVNAAAAIAAGYQVDRVELVFLPRSGELTEHTSWVWSAPFDQAVADEAVEWASAVNAEILSRHDRVGADIAEGLRDKDPSFCYAYCPFATACRGAEPEHGELDDTALELAREHLAAQEALAEAQARLNATAEKLLGVTGARDGIKVVTTPERNVKRKSIDTEGLIEELHFYNAAAAIPVRYNEVHYKAAVKVSRGN